ncbi:MAG: PKD domain-containing protein, partial [Actinobacteria bacterium]|nr:PKD domain-containing protein [Actinomycetota bacterium]
NPTTVVRNFGWPCYEGGDGSSEPQSGYQSLDVCDPLYADPTGVTPSLFAYRHDEDITDGDECPPAEPGPFSATSSSITGLAFYPGGNYPGAFNGALFGADYSRNCIWVMYPGGGGVPDPSTVEIFHYEPDVFDEDGQLVAYGIRPVDLEMGPDGNMWYVSYLQGVAGRFRYTAGNTPPVAVIDADPTSGGAPLEVTFDGSDSFDPDGHPIVEYVWDLDNDGQFDDGSGTLVSWTFDEPGSYTARLRVTDFPGESDITSVNIQASNNPPSPTINTPSAGTLWSVGQTINFSGGATDPEEGTLPASRLTWDIILHHCEDDGLCHEHPLQTLTGVSSGSFSAPDHEYPSHLELRLTAVDQFGVDTTVNRLLDPRTAHLTFATNPVGLELVIAATSVTSPFADTFIVGSQVNVSAPSPQETSPDSWWGFESWSHGRPAGHVLTVPSTNTTYTATYGQVLGPIDGDGFGVVD